MSGILNLRDVFAVLPTGFGKSACFQCLPLLFDELCPSNNPSIVLDVTLLTAIMKDQVTNSWFKVRYRLSIYVDIKLICAHRFADTI